MFGVWNLGFLRFLRDPKGVNGILGAHGFILRWFDVEELGVYGKAPL